MSAGKAAGKGDAGAFFRSAREAVSLRIADERGINPEAVTAADIDALEVGEKETVMSIFSEADRLDYSEGGGDAADLAGWKVKLDEVVRNLTFNRKDKTL